MMTLDTLHFNTGYMDAALDDLDKVVEYATEDLADVDFDTIVGTGFSGGIVIPTLALALGKKFVLVRKDADDSHHSGKVLGRLGKRWIFVDDFMSSGATKRRVFERLDYAQEGSWQNDGSFATTYVGDYFYVHGYNARQFEISDGPGGWRPAESYEGVLR